MSLSPEGPTAARREASFAFHTRVGDGERIPPRTFIRCTYLRDRTPMAAKTTQSAFTDEQLTILNTAKENPNATPSELADLIDSPTVTPDLCASILDGYHLPEEADKPESEAGRRIDGRVDDYEEITLGLDDIAEAKELHYRCAICGKTSADMFPLKSHVAASGGAHEGRKASEDPHLILPDSDAPVARAIERLTKRPDATAPIAARHIEVLYVIVTGEDVTTNELADHFDVNNGTIYNALRDLDILGEDKSATSADRKAAAKDLIGRFNISFTEDEGDAAGETNAADESDREESKEDLAITPKMDPEEVPVVDLDPGDTKENTELGAWYSGVVNGVENYGVFVTLAKGTTGGMSDLRGLAHKSNLPPLYMPSDYTAGDEIVVERTGGGEGEKLALRVVTDPDGEFMVDGPTMPVTGEDAGASEETAEDTPADEEPEEDAARVAHGNVEIEGGLDLTSGRPTQTITDRPVTGSAGDEDEAEGEEAAAAPRIDPETATEDVAARIGARLAEGLGDTEEELVAARKDICKLINEVEALADSVDALASEPADDETGAEDGDEDRPFTLHLTREEMKTLIGEGPEDLVDRAIDSLAEGP